MLHHIQLTEIDQEVPPTLSLPYGQRHDTTDVIILRTLFLFTEVPYEPSTDRVDLCDHVEKEGFDVVEEGFVVKKHLGKEA